MKLLFEIARRAPGEDRSRWQRIPWETQDENATVAAALRAMNACPGLRDEKGEAVGRIEWECSCLQKKCGACAMRINGVPRLACDARLAPMAKKPIRLEPLAKFPVVADLRVDRRVMMDALREMKSWLERDAAPDERTKALSYEAARCLQCGCCLEVCPNFAPGEVFAGTAALAPLSRLLALLPEEQAELRETYRRRYYEGCGKSLACRDICPAGLDVEALLVNSNGAAVWKRRRKRG